MCAELALKEEQLQSLQADFRGLPLLTNGNNVRSIPAGEGIVSSVHTASSTASPDVVAEPKTTTPVRGVLVATTPSGEFRADIYVQLEQLSDGSLKTRFFDQAEILKLELLHTFTDQPEGSLNIRSQFVEKPLDAALSAARFVEVLATQSGQLFMELHEPTFHRFPVVDLPLAVPEPKLEGYRDRLRVLDGLHEIWVETGVEIRYPKETEDAEGLNNLNFVLAAIRGGWVVQQVASFSGHLPTTEVRALLDELRDKGEILRAFAFDLPDEEYRVFSKEVSLGSSRRYLAAARLVATEEELKAWLSKESGDSGTLELRWEPVDGAPMHVFFDEWPRPSIRSINRELREFEAVYGVSSERFGQAWKERESWAREVLDGKRWFSLIQGREENTQES